MSIIKDTMEFLQSDEKSFIVLTNLEDNSRLGKSEIYFSDVPNQDLAGYIKMHLGQTTQATLVWIEYRTKYGSSSRKEGRAYKIQIEPTAPPAPVQIPIQAPAPVHHTPLVATPMDYQNANNNWLGSPNIGLGAAQLIDLHSKANKLEDVKELLDEKKKELNSLSNKYETLIVDHRKALTDLAIAEAQKNMAVLIAKSENKSIFDSPAFTNLMERAPDIFMAMKTGTMPESGTLGLGAASQLSGPKQDLIDHITSTLTDNDANFLGSVAHFLPNASFMQELHSLLTKYHANSTDSGVV